MTEDGQLKAKLTVRSLLNETAGLKLVLLAGEPGLDRNIAFHRMQKPGLALTGLVHQVQPECVQIMGAADLAYLASLPVEEAHYGIERLMALESACIVVTKGLAVPAELFEAADHLGVPLLSTRMRSSQAIAAIQDYIERELAPSASISATLLEVFGVGILLLGPPGVGKSEAALELVMRGHRLISDDLVEVRRGLGGKLVGWAAELIKNHMDVRGVGIINIRDMFGMAAVREEKRIDLVIEFVPWEDHVTGSIGMDDQVHLVLDVPVPMLSLPVSRSHQVSRIIEVAAYDRLRRAHGPHATRELSERLHQSLADLRLRPSGAMWTDSEARRQHRVLRTGRTARPQ